jgi:molybdenum cofactor cytidylyltransferase
MNPSARQGATSIGAVILAAGRSRRMVGVNKLLLAWHEQTMIETVIETVQSSGIHTPVVVLGYQAEQLRRLLTNHAVILVDNPRYREGMTTSIQVGIAALAADLDGYLICLGDQPLLRKADLVHMFQTFQQSPRDAIVVPEYDGRRGHPVLFSSAYRKQILNHRDLHGCRAILSAHSRQVRSVSVAYPLSLADVDSHDDYHRLRRLTVE